MEKIKNHRTFLILALIAVGVYAILLSEAGASIVAEDDIRKTNSASKLNFSVARATEWDSLFDRRKGWTGADGIYSIPLSGNEVYDPSKTNRTIFLFSDTFIGEVDFLDRRKSGTKMVNNTVALLKGSSPELKKINFYWGKDGNNDPRAVFIPQTPNTASGDWYWLMDGISLNGGTNIFALRMKTGSGGVFNFAAAGVSLISVPNTSDDPLGKQTQIDTPLFIPASGDTGEMIFGAALMDNTERSGAENLDGFIYIYGTQNDPLNKKVVAARTTPENFNNFDAWNYWNGASWEPGALNAVPITDRVSSEYSVTPLPDGRFLLVFQEDTLGRNVDARIGESPVGPFGNIKQLWRCPEPDYDKDIYCYNAKAHPHLSKPGELLISYNVNSFSFADHLEHADIYHPRFITVKFN